MITGYSLHTPTLKRPLYWGLFFIRAESVDNVEEQSSHDRYVSVMAAATSAWVAPSVR